MKNEIKEVVFLAMFVVCCFLFVAVQMTQIKIKPNQFLQQANAALLLR